VIVGAVFVACVLLFRRGIVGELARLRWPTRHRGPGAAHAAQPTTEVAAEVAP
jgi:hypothetical protein